MADPAKRGAEDHYRQEGYEPEFDTLPWRHEQEAIALAAPGEREPFSADASEVTAEAYAFEEDGIPLSAAAKPNWFEQSIARLAASRFVKQAPK